MPSNFFWYDLMTPDLEKAANYYCDVVGWGIQASGAPGMGYRLFTIDDIGVAGLMTVPDGVKVSPPVWSGYIAVDDVDLGAKDIERAGGQVHRGPFEVPDIIRMAVVSDPQGAMFLVAKGLKANRPPMPPVGTSGTVGWHELYAGDGPRAMDFYEKLFGWKRGDALDMGPMGIYQLFSLGDEPIGGIMTKPPHIPHPVWNYYINVNSISSAVDRATAGGGNILHGPVQVPGGKWIVQGKDPQGAHFSLVSMVQ
jgi:uncharacterized protein